MNPHLKLPVVSLCVFNWPSDHMIRSQSFIGISELCLLYNNSEEVQNRQSHYKKNLVFFLLKSPLAAENKESELLSASVESVGVSCIWEFFVVIIFLEESAT